MIRRTHGFTLVEVLVALVVMSVLAVMAWQGVDGIARARDISLERTQRTLRLTTVIAQWDQDLQSLFDSGVVPALSFDGATVRLVRTAPGGVQLVAWSLQGGQWRRWTGPVATRAGELQDSWMRSQQLSGNEAGQVSMLDELTEVQLYFYRGNGWSNAQSTGDLAQGGGNAPAREVLPDGARLLIGFGERRLTRDLVLTGQQP
jgi:general secretion pathway protein J